MGKYEAAGTGLSNPDTRKNLYTGAIILGAVVLAGAITFGALTMEDVESFVDLAIRLVGVLGGIGVLTTAALAKANVMPPDSGAESLDNVRADPDGTHGA